MSVYFIIRFLLDLVVSIILLRILGKASRMFKKQRARKAYLIYVPTLISLILVLQVVLFTAPKLVDIVRLAGGQVSFARIEVTEKRFLPGALTDDSGNKYYYSPIGLKAEKGERIAILYLPNSRYIIEAETQDQLPSVSDEGDISE